MFINKTMASLKSVKVAVVIDREVNEFPCLDDDTAEVLREIVCLRHNIPPLTRILFGIRIKGKDVFVKHDQVLDGKEEYELRIRYKVPNLEHLITLDEITFDYYFQQARNDVNNSKIPEIEYKDRKEELLALGIIDMVRAVHEGDLPLKDVQKNYRNRLKSLYLEGLYGLAPNYLAEEYNVLWISENSNYSSISEQSTVALFHQQMSGIRMLNTQERETVDNGNDDGHVDRPSVPTIPMPEGSPSVARPGSYEPTPMQSIISQGKTYLVTKIHKVGSGNYGDVYRGMMESDSDRNKGRTVAIKTLRSSSAEAKYEAFKNELDIMKALQHDHIVEILGFSNSGPEVLIVMEYLEEGSLNNYLNYNKKNIRISHLLKYALDIASGMKHISAKNIVHRDLATRNILVVNRNNVKISDFGLARMLSREETEYKVQTERPLPFNWYAPESVVAPWQFSTKSDVWSYGVTVWEMFTFAKVQVPKFDLTKPRERTSCFGIPDKCPEGIYQDLMMDCWALDPNRRPRFTDLMHTCQRLQEKYSSSNMYVINSIRKLIRSNKYLV